MCVGLILAAPAAAALEIRDVSPTYGPLGPTRPTASVAPGDELCFRYTIVGVHSDGTGRVDGELRIQLTAADGREVFNNRRPVGGVLALGGRTLAGTASVGFAADAPAGEYTLRVTFADRLGSASASFERKVSCTASAFALVRLRLSDDEQGAVSAAAGTLGQTVYVRCKAVGFDRSQSRVVVVIAMQTLDAEGHPLMPRPIEARVATGDPAEIAKLQSVDFNGSLNLNRVGDFTLLMTARDEVSGKTTELRVPLRVFAAP